MKKTKKITIVIALSLLAAQRAFAQSSVTLYGQIDAGLAYVSNQAGHAVGKTDDGIALPNFWGIKGTEDLGGGTTAIFDLESQFVLGDGTGVQQGLFGRAAYVGLDNKRFGTLTFGNQLDFMFTSLTVAGDDAAVFSTGIYDFPGGPFQKLNIPENPTGYFDWSRVSGQPLANAVRYQSPTISGLSVGALYSFGGVAGSFGTNSAMSFGLNYTSGPFGFGAAYTQVKYPGSANDSPQIPVRNWGIGAHYLLGPVYLVASLVTVRNEYLSAAAYAAQFAAHWHITPAWSLGGAYMYMKGNNQLNNNHANQISAILDYSFSKRTTAYVEAVYQRASAGAQASIDEYVNADSSSTPSQAIIRVGYTLVF